VAQLFLKYRIVGWRAHANVTRLAALAERIRKTAAKWARRHGA